jgi:hypothetical protein
MFKIKCSSLNSEASPPIEASIYKLGHDVYQMGSKFTCEKVTGKVPGTSIATWEDNDETYCLRETTEKESLCDENNPLEDLIHQAGTSSAVWAIGTNAICKVKTWCEGMELESDTLAFLSGHFPHIPIPEVIYSWLDRAIGPDFSHSKTNRRPDTAKCLAIPFFKAKASSSRHYCILLS